MLLTDCPDRLARFSVQERPSRKIQIKTHVAVGWMAKFWRILTHIWGISPQSFFFCNLCQCCRVKISFWQNIGLINICKNLPWSKTAGLCQNADGSQPTKNFLNQKVLRRTEQRCVCKTAIKLRITIKIGFWGNLGRCMGSLSCAPTLHLIHERMCACG